MARRWGCALRYVEEPEPLGTGGALKYAEDLLDERFFMLNGDVLSDMDLTAQLRQHEQTGARATLALIGRGGSVGLRSGPSSSPTARSGEFLEKPSADEVLDTNLVNAGAYILEREVLGAMAPAGTRISIEREVFPTLVDKGLYGYEATGYWLDIGTPAALPAGDVRDPRRRRADRGRRGSWRRPGGVLGACDRRPFARRP